MQEGYLKIRKLRIIREIKRRRKYFIIIES